MSDDYDASMQGPDGHPLELVMPFVVCKSQGGPYDDDAFVAGWHLAQIHETLQHSGASWAGYIREASLPQLDLIAMKRGLHVVRGEHAGGWLAVSVGVVATFDAPPDAL